MFFLAVTRISLSTGVDLPRRRSGFDADLYLHRPRSQSCPSLPLPQFTRGIEGFGLGCNMSPRAIAIHVSVSTTKSADGHTSLALCDQDSDSCSEKAVTEQNSTLVSESETMDDVSSFCSTFLSHRDASSVLRHQVIVISSDTPN